MEAGLASVASAMHEHTKFSPLVRPPAAKTPDAGRSLVLPSARADPRGGLVPRMVASPK